MIVSMESVYSSQNEFPYGYDSCMGFCVSNL